MKIFPETAACFGGSHPLHRRAVRFCTKGALGAAAKQRWSFIKAAFQTPLTTFAQEFAPFIDALPEVLQQLEFRKIARSEASAASVAHSSTRNAVPKTIP